VCDARLVRHFPDRFRVAIGVRRPRLDVVVDDRVVAMVDGDGIALPPSPTASGLPRTVVRQGPTAPAGGVRYGAAFPDDRVLAAAAVAREWYEHVAPSLESPPELVEVDAANLGWRFIGDPEYSQVVVGVARADGGVVHLHYGLAWRQGGPVAAEVKAAVLAEMLAEHPGLLGLAGGDLRRRNLWRHCVVPDDSGNGAPRPRTADEVAGLRRR
jgi:hypothetical protein